MRGTVSGFVDSDGSLFGVENRRFSQQRGDLWLGRDRSVEDLLEFVPSLGGQCEDLAIGWVVHRFVLSCLPPWLGYLGALYLYF